MFAFKYNIVLFSKLNVKMEDNSKFKKETSHSYVSFRYFHKLTAVIPKTFRKSLIH